MIEAEVVCREVAERIERALTEDEFWLLRARLAGYTQEEIAEAEGVSQPLIHRRWGRVKEKIRCILVL